MQPEDDDGAETGSGPPPDPSLRAWRHPSEIAAASAAAARPLEVHRSVRAPLLTVGGTALGMVALLGLALYLASASGDGGRPLSGVTAQQRGDSGRALASTTAPRATVSVSATVAGRAGLGSGVGAGAVSTTSTTPPATSAPTTTVPTSAAPSDPATTDERELTEPAPTASLPGGLLDEALQPPAAEQVDGVFGIDGSRLRRLGGFVALEGMVFASASALDGREQVALLTSGAWIEADVIGVDRFTDVAVLTVAADATITSLGTNPSNQFEALAIAAPVPGMKVALAMPGTIDPDLATGTVIGDDLQATTQSGSAVYGALRTSVGRRPGAPGSALRTEDAGGVIGFVIDSSGYLLSAIPIERVLDVGRSFLERGIPAVEWLGVKGTSGDDVGVVLSDIADGGPAMLAGALPGDEIVALDGVPVENMDHLVYLVRMAGAGAVVTLMVERDGQPLALEATIGVRPGG